MLVAHHGAAAVTAHWASELQQAIAAGIPTGPFAFLDSKRLKSEINGAMEARARKGTTACTVRIGKTIPHTPTLAGKGTVVKLECTQAKASACKFCLWFEFTHEGFQLYNANLEHTGHELPDNVHASMALAGGRTIPPDYEDLGSLLAESGLSAHEILRYDRLV